MSDHITAEQKMDAYYTPIQSWTPFYQNPDTEAFEPENNRQQPHAHTEPSKASL